MVSGSRREERDVLGGELARELLEARLVANLATIDRDGAVHLVGMWFLWDGEALLLPTSRTTRKANNIRAELREGEEAVATNRQIHLKYVTERGRELDPVDRYLATDNVTIRLVPERVSSWNLRDTDHGRALLETKEFHPLD